MIWKMWWIGWLSNASLLIFACTNSSAHAKKWDVIGIKWQAGSLTWLRFLNLSVPCISICLTLADAGKLQHVLIRKLRCSPCLYLLQIEAKFESIFCTVFKCRNRLIHHCSGQWLCAPCPSCTKFNFLFCNQQIKTNQKLGQWAETFNLAPRHVMEYKTKYTFETADTCWSVTDITDCPSISIGNCPTLRRTKHKF